MRKDEMAKLVEGLDDDKLRDLGIGIGMHRTEIGLGFCDVGDNMMSGMNGWTGVQSLAIIELGWAAWMKGHPHMVAHLVLALGDDWSTQCGLKLEPRVFLRNLIRLPQSYPHAKLMQRMQLAAAAALTHGVDVWWEWIEDNGDVYSVANFDPTVRCESEPSDEIYYLRDPPFLSDPH